MLNNSYLTAEAVGGTGAETQNGYITDDNVYMQLSCSLKLQLNIEISI